jgi:hypothetical protein
MSTPANWIAGGIQGGAGIGQAIGSKRQADREKREANIYRDAALQEIGGIGAAMPTQADLTAQYGYGGDFTPQDYQEAMRQKTAYSDIAVDPRYQDAQNASLRNLQDIYSAGGLTAQDRAQIEDINQQQAMQQKAQQQAIQAQQEQRGMGGAGAGYAAMLSGQQGAAEARARQGFDVAAQAQARRQQAIEQAGQLGGQIRGQSFGEQATVAKEKDALDRFNAELRAKGIDDRNRATQYNMAERQRLGEMNVRGKVQGAQSAYDQQRDYGKMRAGIYSGEREGAEGRRQQAMQGVQTGMGQFGRSFETATAT